MQFTKQKTPQGPKKKEANPMEVSTEDRLRRVEAHLGLVPIEQERAEQAEQAARQAEGNTDGM